MRDEPTMRLVFVLACLARTVVAHYDESTSSYSSSSSSSSSTSTSTSQYCECLTSADCCEFAGPNQVGICDFECKCKFTTSLQCVNETACEQLLSGLVCRAQGECFRPECDAGLCQCHNGTGADLDQDGVPCPEDCDDTDASISVSLTCVLDRDNDAFPDCGSVLDDAPTCLTFCVEPNATCPLGYTDIDDPNRTERVRSQRTDTGVPCESEPVVPEELCDCCDIDKRAFPGSLYVASTQNACGNADYDCDGTSTEQLCCSDGSLDAYSVNERYLWFSAECELAPINVSDGCGGCSTENSAAVLVEGYACESECTGAENTQVAPGMCPNACNNECVCVDEDTPPFLGECAQVIVDCAHVRPTLYADVERCCVVTVH